MRLSTFHLSRYPCKNEKYLHVYVSVCIYLYTVQLINILIAQVYLINRKFFLCNFEWLNLNNAMPEIITKDYVCCGANMQNRTKLTGIRFYTWKRIFLSWLMFATFSFSHSVNYVISLFCFRFTFTQQSLIIISLLWSVLWPIV